MGQQNSLGRQNEYIFFQKWHNLGVVLGGFAELRSVSIGDTILDAPPNCGGVGGLGLSHAVTLVTFAFRCRQHGAKVATHQANARRLGATAVAEAGGGTLHVGEGVPYT